MIVKLKKKNSSYRDLTFGQPYVVIGIEADDFRILNDAGRPFLYPRRNFSRSSIQTNRTIGSLNLAKIANDTHIRLHSTSPDFLRTFSTRKEKPS